MRASSEPSLADMVLCRALQYGKVAVLFHASGLATSIGLSYAFITYGMGGIEPVMACLPDWLHDRVPDGKLSYPLLAICICCICVLSPDLGHAAAALRLGPSRPCVKLTSRLDGACRCRHSGCRLPPSRVHCAASLCPHRR